MSNPAVVKLQKKRIYDQSVWLDDNFGESVHLHINNLRVDLATREFDILSNDLCDSINNLISIKGFDIYPINKTYFESFLWKDLLDLKEVRIEKVRLSDLLCPNSKGKLVKLKDSRGVKALLGDTAENDIYRSSHHIGQTSKDRLERALKGIKENPYPFKGQYIILYNYDYIIRDGQHRASCLYYLYGDIEIDVMRLIFNKTKFPTKSNNFFSRFLYVLRHPRILLKALKRIFKKIFFKSKRKAGLQSKERVRIIALLSEK